MDIDVCVACVCQACSGCEVVAGGGGHKEILAAVWRLREATSTETRKASIGRVFDVLCHGRGCAAPTGCWTHPFFIA